METLPFFDVLIAGYVSTQFGFRKLQRQILTVRTSNTENSTSEKQRQERGDVHPCIPTHSPRRQSGDDDALETNGPDGDGIVTVSSMDAEVVAHVVLLNDLEQGLDMVDVLGLERGLVPDVAKAVVPATQSVSTYEATRLVTGPALDVHDPETGSCRPREGPSQGQRWPEG